MTIRGTKKVVSYFEEIGNGLLIYAPDLLLDRNNYNRESTLERKYFNDLTNLKSELSQKDVELPEYSKKYLLSREELMIDAIEKSKEK